MQTPPTIRLFEQIEKEAHDEFAKLTANKKLSHADKSAHFTRHIEFIQYHNNVVGLYMPNTYKALDKTFKPEDLSKQKVVTTKRPYDVEDIPIQLLMSRLLAALELDRDVTRKGWIKLHDWSKSQIDAFAPANSKKRAREAE